MSVYWSAKYTTRHACKKLHRHFLQTTLLYLDMEEQNSAPLPYHIVRLKDGTEIALLGTAHVSQKSVEDVEQGIQLFQPDTVCIELDKKRFENLKDRDQWKKIDLFTAFRQGQGFLIMANLILSNYQRRMGEDLGVQPGAEMLRAIQLAEEQHLLIALCDRSITTTLTRAWRKCGFWARLKLLASLISSGLSTDKLSEEELTRLKQGDALSEMLETMATEAPTIKKVLIDERDLYLAKKIYTAEGQKRLAVIGAGHMQGVIKALEKLDHGDDIDLTELEIIPPKTWLSHVQNFIIPSLLLIGFFWLTKRTDTLEAGKILAKEWLFWNIVMGALGGIIALANPLIILVNALVSPFSSLIPVLSAGTVTALVQIWIQKPRVEDFEGLAHLQGLESWYRNHISHTLIVWMACSIGSSLGALVALGRISTIAS